ncbi:MAG: hypothetical protein AB3N11_14065, partial [Arenibacterium sp.]
MTRDPIDRKGLTPRFWEKKPLTQMSEQEWEALCDGWGKCCVNKREDDETGVVVLTRVAGRWFDDPTFRCAPYDKHHQFVPDCIVLRPDTLESH